MDRPALARWIAGYERAWRTPGTDAAAALFAPEASYRTAPFEEPFRGLDAIRELWEREREGPDERFTMTSEIVAVEGDTGVARVEVRYSGPPERLYRDVWIVTLDGEQRCTAFDEWPFKPGTTHGG